MATEYDDKPAVPLLNCRTGTQIEKEVSPSLLMSISLIAVSRLSYEDYN